MEKTEINEKADFLIDPSSSVDVQGKALLKVDQSINCKLKWAYNQVYKNEIKIY